jgi:predicted RNase H-like nuclease
VDACARGWVAVTLSPGTLVRVAVAATLDAVPLAGVTGIDMPLGLLAEGWREADVLARRALGRRGVTVFAIPPRPVWACESYAEASRLCRELTGKSFSAQAWGLRRKIAEAEAFRRRAAAATPDSLRLYEVHPELSFAALAGEALAAEVLAGEALAGAPLTAVLADSKHTAAGLAARRDLLARAGIDVPRLVPGAAENDLLDAAAVAWSARRIAAGRAVVLANPAQRADDGGEIAIRY